MNINDKLASGLYLAPSKIPDAGIGLFTALPVGAGNPMCEYKGEVYNAQEEIDSKYRFTMQAGYLNSANIGWAQYTLPTYILKHGHSGKWVDAHPLLSSKELGLGGFVNDVRNYKNRTKGKETSDTKEVLSLGYNSVYWPVPNEAAFFIISIREIEEGEEIYADYGNAYWETVRKIDESIKSAKKESPEWSIALQCDKQKGRAKKNKEK